MKVINNMLTVQYPIQFSGPLRNISNSCSAPLCSGEWFNQGCISKTLLNNIKSTFLLHGRRPIHSKVYLDWELNLGL